MTTTLQFTVEAQPTLFTLGDKEYYLVHYKAVEGLTRTTHHEPKAALDAAGHIPAVIRQDNQVLEMLMRHVTRGDGWISLYDCRPDMENRIGYANGLALTDDGLCFYHMSHGGGPGEHPALCERPVT